MVYEVLRYLRDLDYEYVYPRASRPVEGAEGSAAGAGAPNTELGASPASRAIALSEAAQEAAGCEACALAGQRKNVVFGSGNANAELMFVGEGPGAHEDAKGLPFVGPAGELLTRIIEAIDLTREEVYIANIVKCRPPGNRDPLPAEVAACRAFLERQIDLVQPKIVVALGRVAAQTLLGSDLSLGRMRGEWHEFSWSSPEGYLPPRGTASQPTVQEADLGGHEDRARSSRRGSSRAEYTGGLSGLRRFADSILPRGDWGGRSSSFRPSSRHSRVARCAFGSTLGLARNREAGSPSAGS